MTRTTNARLAGVAFLFYIAAGIGSMILSHRATAGEGIAAQLASMAAHSSNIHASAVLTLLCGFSALILGVTLWALTREVDPDLATLGMVCRVSEGVIGGLAVQGSLSLLWLATATGTTAPPPEQAQGIATFLQNGETMSGTIAAAFFALGSTCFSWLLLRGRIIPVGLAWIGLLASVLLVVVLPLQIGGVEMNMLIWIPMAVFEVALAIWFFLKGARAPARTG